MKRLVVPVLAAMKLEEQKEKPVDKRNSGGRRQSDMEANQIAQKAMDAAMAVSAKLETHLAVCEQQNKDILRRLSYQDKILLGILGGVGLEISHLIFTKLFGV